VGATMDSRRSRDDDAPQTALLLTQREWDDLGAMVENYLAATRWVERGAGTALYEEQIRERRALALRIIEANT
jgi:hypothetical protein